MLCGNDTRDHNEFKCFLRTCQLNARFMYNTEKAYAAIAKPLRDLTRKNTKFLWTAHYQQLYKEILHTMSSNTALRPFDSTLKTIQKTTQGTWIAIDHTNREPSQRVSKSSHKLKKSPLPNRGHEYSPLLSARHPV